MADVGGLAQIGNVFAYTGYQLYRTVGQYVQLNDLVLPELVGLNVLGHDEQMLLGIGTGDAASGHDDIARIA